MALDGTGGGIDGIGGIDGTVARVSASGSVALLGKVGAGVRCLSAADVDGDGIAEVVAGTDAGDVWVVRLPH